LDRGWQIEDENLMTMFQFTGFASFDVEMYGVAVYYLEVRERGMDGDD